MIIFWSQSDIDRYANYLRIPLVFAPWNCSVKRWWRWVTNDLFSWSVNFSTTETDWSLTRKWREDEFLMSWSQTWHSFNNNLVQHHWLHQLPYKSFSQFFLKFYIWEEWPQETLKPWHCCTYFELEFIAMVWGRFLPRRSLFFNFTIHYLEISQKLHQSQVDPSMEWPRQALKSSSHLPLSPCIFCTLLKNWALDILGHGVKY